MSARIVLFALALATALAAQPKKILYLTHTAGFRHDCIPASAAILKEVAAGSGKLDLTWTENAAEINGENLRGYQAVLFYTSGELPFSDAQKRDLLAFVRAGGGFAGVHSATDTLYAWSEYGDLIGGYFDGHPWAQEVRIDVEDPNHAAAAHLTPGFRITEEIYQFRGLSRERVRVLMTLDTASIDLRAPGTHPDTTDFPLAWTRTEGSGRVFYCALGHFEETWRDPRFQKMMLGALLWITGQAEGSGEPRKPEPPRIDAAANAASMQPVMNVSPGALASIYGRHLTPGSTASAAYVSKLAGASVTVDGQQAELLYASPDQVNARVPAAVTAGAKTLEIRSADSASRTTITVASAAPGIFAAVPNGAALTLWATGLNESAPAVQVAGRDSRVLYSGVAPQWPGLFQVNVELPPGLPPGLTRVQLTVPGAEMPATAMFTLP